MTSKEFLSSLPAKVNQEALEGVDTNFQFELEGEPGGQYTIIVKNGQLEVLEGLVGEPKCTIRAKDETLMNVVSGKTSPFMALMTGKIKISNQAELMKYARLFGLM